MNAATGDKRNAGRISASFSAVVLALALCVAAVGPWGSAAKATDSSQGGPTDARIAALIPDLESYVTSGMKAFDVPGVAIGIVANDRLVYAKGFGVRRKGGDAAVGPHTVFQIGSTTKAFLATTLAIMVDRQKLRWYDRLIDLDPAFRMKDPWVTREFRVIDLLAQRSGLPRFVNDSLGILGLGEPALIRSLGYVEPVSSFRTTFSYTNITHMLAGRIVAKAAGAPDWNAVLEAELLRPLGMNDASVTAAAIEAAPDHAVGHRWQPRGTVELPFIQAFPYDFAGAGDINASVEAMAHWVRLQLGGGVFEGRRLVSLQNLAMTFTPQVALSPTMSYALGWILQQTPNGMVVWHNGGTNGFGAYVGLSFGRKVGVVVLSNEANFGFPDGVGAWILDRLLGNPLTDPLAAALARAQANDAAAVKRFTRPARPDPSPAIEPLAGSFLNAMAGRAVVAADAGSLVIDLQSVGVKLKLDPFDGSIFTASIVPTGRSAVLAASVGPLPFGFVQWQLGVTGKRDILRLVVEDDQAYDFTRQ